MVHSSMVAAVEKKHSAERAEQLLSWRALLSGVLVSAGGRV